jgi:hypothetical protein
MLLEVKKIEKNQTVYTWDYSNFPHIVLDKMIFAPSLPKSEVAMCHRHTAKNKKHMVTSSLCV